MTLDRRQELIYDKMPQNEPSLPDAPPKAETALLSMLSLKLHRISRNGRKKTLIVFTDGAKLERF